MPATRSSTRFSVRPWWAAALVLMAGVALADYVGLSDRILGYIEDRYGREARGRVEDWQDLVSRSKYRSERDKLRVVNSFFNNLNFIEDIDHWGKRDYWATPVELLATAGGDCEDFAIAKYFSLLELGVEDRKLRVTYVKALELGQAHMVLAYYPTEDADPLVLDNLTTRIKPASQRDDLKPVYSFNGSGLWLAQQRGQGKRVGNSTRISLWTDLAERMADEGGR